jgi:hypothetical protein
MAFFRSQCIAFLRDRFYSPTSAIAAGLDPAMTNADKRILRDLVNKR